MGLDDITTELKNLESIKYYDKVKGERDEAVRRVSELEAEMSTTRDSLARAEVKIGELEKELAEARSRIDSMASDIKVRENEIKVLRSYNETLRSRVKELEGLKATLEGRPLKEVEGEFLRAKEAEIRTEVEEKFQEMKANWEGNEKPKEVNDTAVDELNKIVDVLRAGHIFANSVLVQDVKTPHSILVAKVAEILQSGVNKGLDEEFDRRVEGRSQQVALEKLQGMMAAEWPAWFKARAELEIARLQSAIKANLLNLQNEVFRVTCDRCKTQRDVQLVDEGLTEILSTGKSYVACENPNCRDLGGLQPHTFTVTLAKLLMSKVEMVTGG